MDYLRINENKLKITLTQEELHFYGMDLANLSYSSTETRRAFWAILDDAKHATGFDAAASRVSIQIYASRAGGCEMYVIGIPKSKGSSSDAEDFIPQSIRQSVEEADADYAAEYASVEPMAEYSSALCPVPALSTPPKAKLTATPSFFCQFAESSCEFSRLSDLLGACTALSVSGYDGESSAWWLNDRYYLSLSGNCGSAAPLRISASGILREFGTPIQELTLAYLTEHGKCLCKNDAVDQLAKLAT